MWGHCQEQLCLFVHLLWIRNPTPGRQRGRNGKHKVKWKKRRVKMNLIAQAEVWKLAMKISSGGNRGCLSSNTIHVLFLQLNKWNWSWSLIHYQAGSVSCEQHQLSTGDFPQHLLPDILSYWRCQRLCVRTCKMCTSPLSSVICHQVCADRWLNRTMQDLNFSLLLGERF